MDLKELFSNRASVEVEYGEQKIVVYYAPDKYTPAVHSQVLATQDTQDFDPIVGILKSLVTDWDITSEGEIWPVNEENLRSLPVNLLLSLTGAIMTDVASPKNAKSSPGSSRRAA
jgi:hypothetical protein